MKAILFTVFDSEIMAQAEPFAVGRSNHITGQKVSITKKGYGQISTREIRLACGPFITEATVIPVKGTAIRCGICEFSFHLPKEPNSFSLPLTITL